MALLLAPNMRRHGPHVDPPARHRASCMRRNRAEYEPTHTPGEEVIAGWRGTEFSNGLSEAIDPKACVFEHLLVEIMYPLKGESYGDFNHARWTPDYIQSR
jgi:hypothetical protein